MGRLVCRDSFSKNERLPDSRKNFCSKLGEIAVIVEQTGVSFFIEFKARSGHEFGRPFAVLTFTRQKKMTKFFLQEENLR